MDVSKLRRVKVSQSAALGRRDIDSLLTSINVKDIRKLFHAFLRIICFCSSLPNLSPMISVIRAADVTNHPNLRYYILFYQNCLCPKVTESLYKRMRRRCPIIC